METQQLSLVYSTITGNKKSHMTSSLTGQDEPNPTL